jgi:methionine sulfoxide reductase heme-binding subunit
MYPWLDYSGRVSPLKSVVFAALFVPAIWVAAAYPLDLLGPRPLNEAIHQIGLWGIRFLFIALAVTPARHMLQWPRVLLVRRMIGVAAFAYIAVHLSLYAVDQGLDLAKVASEIVLRFYLTIGFTAFLGLTALAITSTDGMTRRLGGKRWQQLHRLVYPIGVLAATHYFIQSKLNVYEPMVMIGLFAWLMGYRAITWTRRDRKVPLWCIPLLGIAASVLTALGETLYFYLKIGVSPALVLPTNLTLATGIRPGVVVLVCAATVTAMATARSLMKKRAPKLRLRTA